ncbi:hypothetical protein J2X24_001444 [Asticcacaulis solisilvae]|nr:LytTR family DNA-binding domain-containing protein [Asticcacaulis solisilvae]MBP2158881.1 hypothetical protein [Asticcacaulis solisilvae]MDR6799926.1 hypothetical protein [Asticcacaulis sp. BE141]
MLAACALVMALAGPFGQAERFLPSQRIGLWLMYLAAGLPMLALVLTGLRRWLTGIPLAGMCAAAASLPILLVVETIGLIEGRPLPHGGLDWLRSAAEVAVLCVPFAVLLERFLRPVEAKPAAVTALLIAADVRAVCAEGHYTRLFTPRGEQFLDHSFSEVLMALEGRDGAQVHRSWWVARGAVEGLQRKGSAAVLKITGGLAVPFARRRLTKLRGEGWPV